jgi:hypothetical protein
MTCRLMELEDEMCSRDGEEGEEEVHGLSQLQWNELRNESFSLCHFVSTR